MMKKPAAYIPILLVIIAIFYLTMMKPEATMALSNGFQSYLVKLCGVLGIDVSDKWWNTSSGIRQLGHLIEYFALGLAAGFTVRNVLPGALIFILVSLSDQALKIVLPVRHLDKHDMPFDIAGYAIGFMGALIVVFVVSIFSNRDIGR